MAEDPEKSTIISTVNRYASWPVLGLITLYRYAISPLIGQRCRFYPTCSEYAETAYRRFGFIKGSVLSTKRLCKCHPWHAGGVDLVPESASQKNQSHDQ
ncbi:membrane protein insertion efficiency factor YidD [Eionea flava]